MKSYYSSVSMKMEMFITRCLFFVALEILSIYGYESIVNYTEPHVITTPNHPDPYPPHVNCTWQWSKSSGIWAVLFDYLDVSCQDSVYIVDVASKRAQPFGCTHSIDMPIYIHGSSLKIRFTSKHNHAGHHGFKLRVLSGTDLDDVKIQVYDLRQKEKKLSENHRNHTNISLVVFLVVLIFLISGLLAFWMGFVRRRRQQNNGTVSVAVSVNHVRRDSGVTYKRTPSTSESATSESTTDKKTSGDTDRRKLLRSISQRSWTTKAVITTSPNAAADNLYTPMGQYENQISRPQMIRTNPLSKPVPCTEVFPFTNPGYETVVGQKQLS